MESVLDFVLDGLEKALELERELGVRSIELNRELLMSPVSPPSSSSPPPLKQSNNPDNRTLPPPPSPSPIRQSNNLYNSNNRTIPPSDLVFVHDRPLSAKGVEMMAKIITAMGTTAAKAPIVIAPPLPKAKIVVVLGGLALKKYFPGMRGEPGQWQRTPEGCDVLITYSPEYILRFATVTPAVQKIKQDMWRSLKAVVQRLCASA